MANAQGREHVALMESDEDENASSELYDPTEHDRSILHNEEQEERLLMGPSDNDGQTDSNTKGLLDTSREERRRERRRQRKDKRRRGKGDKNVQGQLFYEMEEGGSRDDASSQSSSSSLDLGSAKRKHALFTQRRRTASYIVIALVISILFVLLTYGSYRTSYASNQRPTLSTLSNGTSSFGPTTILISLDGFRADFLHRNLTPTLDSFVAQGVSPKYMLPSFPSVTFPNHYTIVTGLYPESHGVVGNSFWDADFGEEFYYTDPTRSMQPKWWSGGEPLWVTAEMQDLKSAIHMWPGSEAHVQPGPSYLDKFNGSESLSRKADRILQFLDIPGPRDADIEGAQTRPQLIAAYVPNVDADGHKYGPNSTEIRKTIADVDEMLHQLFVGIDNRNLSNIVNIVVVSDHGMATTSTDRLVQLDDLIDLSLVEHIDGWPLYGLRPKDPDDLRQLYNTLKAEAATNTNFEVYLRDENMPDRYHFSTNERIAPLWVVPKAGWAIVHKDDFDIKEAKAKGMDYHPKGLHGYDHEHPLMRAIFVARGPAFPHEPNSMLAPFQNIEIYNIICDSLGIEPKANNGTLRLPFKPTGLHSDQSTSPEEMAVDLPSETQPAENEIGKETTETQPLSNETQLVNNTVQDGSRVGEASGFREKWKQMVEKVKAAMAKFIAKLRHGSSSTKTSPNMTRE